MHQKAIDNITGKISESLKFCSVKNNWPEYESFHEYVDSFSKDILKEKSKWLDKSDIYSIYYDLLYKKIKSVSSAGDENSRPLSDFLSSPELDSLRDELVGFYFSIPRE